MWTSAAASGFGDRMIELAALPMLGVLADDAQASSVNAAVYFWYFLPWLFITPIGGWLADTFPRKWLMLACDEGRALLLLLACLMVPAGMMADKIPPSEAWQVYAILAGVGAFAAVFSPTRNALIPQIVPLSRLNAANALVLCIGVIASLIGYIIGSHLFSRYTMQAGLIVALLAFGVSGTFFAFLRPRPHTGLDTDRHLSEWVRLLRATAYIRAHAPVRNLVLLNALGWTLAMVVATAVAALVKHRYNIPADRFIGALAMMNGMLGAGMLIGAGLIAFMNTRRETSAIIMLAFLCTAFALAGLAAAPTYAIGMAMCFLIGVCGGAALILISTLTQAITPNYILGRVGGVREVLSNISAVGVNLVIWQMPGADAWMVPAMYAMALALALIGGYGCFRQMTAGPMDSRTANALWRFDRWFCSVWHRLRHVGKHRVPSAGPVILAANHTTGLDPFAIQAALTRRVTWIMLRKYQYRLVGFVWRAVRPIALDLNNGDLGSLKQIIERLRAGDAVGLFPEGELQRDHRNLGPFAAGIAMIAVRSGAPIVPVWIDGTPLKKRMFWHFAWPSRTTVIFGQPYRPDPDWDYQRIADDLRARLLDLAAAWREGQQAHAQAFTHAAGNESA